MQLSRLSFLVSAVTALIVSSPRGQEARVFAIPGSTTRTRLWGDRGTWHAAVSRDGGDSWSDLVAPDFRISTQYAEFDPGVGEPVVVPALAAPATNTLYLVQFQTPVVGEYRDALKAAGAEIHSFMAYQSYLVRMDAAAAARVAALEFVRYVGDYHPAYRLDPVILDKLASGVPMADARYDILVVDHRTDAPALAAAITRAGGTVELVDRILVSATLSQAQLQAIARENTVMWIDPWSPPEHDMNNARLQAGVERLYALPEPFRIDGRGLNSHVNEGVYAQHPEFRPNPPYRMSVPIGVGGSGSTPYGTSTAGEIWAEGIVPRARGVAPYSQPYYTPAASNYVSLYNELTGIHGVFATTQSWDGSRVTTYTSQSATRDLAVFESGIYATQSQSNAGAQPSRPGAWAKNTASVGAFEHYNNANPADDCWCRTGSIGPAADGRIGVTFTGYYDNVFTTVGASGYGSIGGSSGATPMVNGFSLLAMEMFSDGLFGYPAAPIWSQRAGTLPKFTTTKSLVMATTRQLNWSNSTSSGANRYEQGWGFPNVGDLYDLRDHVLVIDEDHATISGPSRDVLEQGEARTYWVFVPPATTEFRAALTWADVPGNPANQAQHRVNDLNLTVWSPTGVRYAGNIGLLNGPFSVPASQGNNDKDTEEMVILPNPPSGVWTVEVRGSEIVADTHVETPELDADYALTVRGIGGGRDTSGMVLDVQSSQPGDFTVAVTNLPATGWTHGYTLLSADASRYASLGNLLGIEADALTLAGIQQVPAEGNVFAFTSSGNPNAYPNAAFHFPAVVALLLSGTTLDATVVLVDAQGAIVGVSNVDRETIR